MLPFSPSGLIRINEASDVFEKSIPKNPPVIMPIMMVAIEEKNTTLIRGTADPQFSTHCFLESTIAVSIKAIRPYPASVKQNPKNSRKNREKYGVGSSSEYTGLP